MPAARTSTLAAAMGMIHGVLGHTAYVGSSAQPTGSAGLADGDIAVVHVGKLADGGLAFGRHQPKPAAGFGELGGSIASTLERLGAGARGKDDADSSVGVRHPLLSKRQSEVLALMVRGLTNAEIASALGLSPNTIKIHVSAIMARLGLDTRAQVIHWALTR